MRRLRRYSLLIAAAGLMLVAVQAVACGDGDGDDEEPTPIPTVRVSFDDFVSSANPICSEFATLPIGGNPHDPARYEDAASALTQLTLPSDDAERKRAEALVEAMGRRAVAQREFFSAFFSAMGEYVDPGMTLLITEDGSLYQYPAGGSLNDLEIVDGFPTEIALRNVETTAALRQAAADLGLEECAPPEEE